MGHINVLVVLAADDVVRYKFGEKSSKALSSSGFNDVTFKSYAGYVVLIWPKLFSWISYGEFPTVFFGFWISGLATTHTLRRSRIFVVG